MMIADAQGLKKRERVSSKRTIDKLFGGTNSRSLTSYPLRLVYQDMDRVLSSDAGAQMMVSVPKRYFKRAVKRNRVKRQIREAYRHHKSLLPDREGKTLVMAFIWMDDQLHESEEINKKVENLLMRVRERL
ncbi:MAG: ribonuclease P protein component [Prevotella sp.]|jgi:ribonuclease P protein component|nr:ribonuclease P protein component [Prevotella sp.]MBP3828152.1 ribonuclease P protein component [Prevotella sp.]MBQ6032172.1 ribonuclease P protein component [Prevotella sp.]MBQ7717580.1 ribonuclease P protein component [Prevotella sp.]MBR0524056.1 ribonuclease P protein component [Prevotella sp.]